MKNTIKAIAVATALLAGTSAFAETVKIEGSSGALAAGCSFQQLTDGGMNWSEANGEWSTFNPAKVKVKVRDIISLEVAATKNLKDAVGTADVVKSVDYSLSSVTGSNARQTPVTAIAENSIVVTETGANYIDIDIDHTLVAGDNFVAESNTNYYMENIVTCNQ